jgi:NADPH-dependent 2,4-dienoyl-CoA reductase/sulfur reductase-like enzyme
MAALTAARSGARVIVCDEDFCLGGRLLADRREVGGMPGNSWAAQVVNELGSLPDVRLMPRTTVFGVYDGGIYEAVERVADHLPEPPPHAPRQRLWRIIAKRAVLAAGASERGIVFGGNDRPGVMLASAMRTYVNRFAVAPGRKVAFFTNNDDGWDSAADLIRAGVPVTAVVDSRPDSRAPPEPLKTVRVIGGGEVIATVGARAPARDHCSVPERPADDRSRRAWRLRRVESQCAPRLPPRRTPDLGAETCGVRPEIHPEGNGGRRGGEWIDDSCSLPCRGDQGRINGDGGNWSHGKSDRVAKG